MDKYPSGSSPSTSFSAFGFQERDTQLATGNHEEEDRSDEREDTSSDSEEEQDDPLDEAIPITMMERLHVSDRPGSRGNSESSLEIIAVEGDHVVSMLYIRILVGLRCVQSSQDCSLDSWQEMLIFNQLDMNNLVAFNLVTEADVNDLFEL
jgi:hypothetical protein